MSTLLSRLWRIKDRHFAVAAIKMQRKPLSVVKKEERTAILATMVLGTFAKLVADAVSASHEFSTLGVI